MSKAREERLICLKVLSVVLALSVCTVCESSAERITGRIIAQADSISLPDASVVLLQLPDSTFVESNISGANGAFEFSRDFVPEKYICIIDHPGYEKLIAELDANNMVIALSNRSSELGEVTVTGFRQRVKSIAGGVSFNPKDLVSISTSAASLLEKVPFITYKNGQVSVFGKGASVIYINGREPSMPNEILAQMLNAMPPDDIKQVDILMDPGASFSAQFTGAVVNITIKEPTEGWLGAVEGYAALNNGRISPDVDAAVSYSAGKLNVSAMGSFTSDGSPLHTSYEQIFHDTGIKIRTSERSHGHAEKLKAFFSAGYSFSDRTRLETKIRIGTEKSHFTYNSTSVKEQADGSTSSSFYDRTKRNPFQSPWVQASLVFYQRTDSRGSELKIKADYIYRDERDKSTINNNGTEQYRISQDMPGNFTLAADYLWKIGQRHSLYFGYNLNIDDSRSNLSDSGHSNLFDYNLTENDFFANYSGGLSDKVWITAGIRLEHSRSNAHLLWPDDTQYAYSRWDWSPNFSVSWQINAKNSLNISGRRNIRHPHPLMMNPFIDKYDDYNYYQGNPVLKPTASYNASLLYSLMNDFGLMANYSFSSRSNMEISRPGEFPNSIVSTRDEVHGRFFQIGARAYWQKQLFGGIWYMSYALDLAYLYESTVCAGIPLKQINRIAALSTQHQVILSRRNQITALVGASLTSPCRMISGKDHGWQPMLNLSLKKAFKSAELKLDIYNLGYYVNRTVIDTPEYYYYYKSDIGNIDVRLTFSYYFGNRRVKKNYLAGDANEI